MLARVINWDTGVKGEATAIYFPVAQRLQFVDLGCRFYAQACYDIHHDLHELCNSIPIDTLDVILTHLHMDHYSLTPLIPHCCLLNISKVNAVNIYVPGIPRTPPEARNIVLRLLALHEIALKTIARSVSEALRPIIDLIKRAGIRSKPAVLYRGNKVNIGGGMHIRVVWPPKEFPQELGSRLEELKRRYGEIVELLRKACEHDKDLCKDIERHEEDARMLGKEFEKLDQERERKKEEGEEGYVTVPPDSALAKYILPAIIYPLPDIHYYHNIYYYHRPELIEALVKISDALNDFSLILEYYYNNEPIIVIPGDNSDDVLNYVGNLEEKHIGGNVRDVVFLRGAHHGTYYGKYLNLFRADIVWLSRHDKGYQYRREYWDNLNTRPSLVLTAQNVTKTGVIIKSPNEWYVHARKKPF
ncbi:MAG: hypothetical protein RXQ97_02395 [Caldivirga sp.]|jgi:hypothetical protein